MFDLEKIGIWLVHAVIFGATVGVFFRKLNYIDKKLTEKEEELRELKQKERIQAQLDEEVQLQKLKKHKKRVTGPWINAYEDNEDLTINQRKRRKNDSNLS